MRIISIVFLFILLAGCSSGANDAVVPVDDTSARVGLSDPYMENGEHYVDLSVENIAALYQFSMRLEFNHRCIEFIGFEPSEGFSDNPLMLSEKIRFIPPELKADMFDSSNGMAAIAVSRPFPDMGDIKSPRFIGRIRFQLKCGATEMPFRIFNRPDYLIFRDHRHHRLDIKPFEPHELTGGERK